MRVLIAAATLLLAAAAAAAGTAVAEPRVSHGISLFGELKYPADFPHFDYVEPDAPKGGTVRLSTTGTYDTLNPFTLRGNSAAGLGLTYDTLMESARDEPSAEYGLVARSVEVPEDLSWAAFELRPEARFHDGRPITADDVVFSFETLKTKGAPFYRYYYQNVEKAVAEGPHRVRFSFTGKQNRELPLIVGQLPILPKHYWEGRDFEATTLESPPGSGPYRVAEVDPGRSIGFQRVEDYWGRDLPVMRGRYNFAQIRYEYYRDRTIAMEAFKSGGIDYWEENSAKRWATGFDFEAIRDGLAVKAALPDESPTGMQAFVFNTRRPFFADPRVRQALGYAFDFEWSNKVLFYGQYKRTESYFANSELAARGLPDAAELAILEPLRGQIPEEVFTTPFALPRSDGSGRDRRSLKAASELLAQAGWTVQNGKLTHQTDGAVMRFEILLVQPDMDKVAAPMVQNLQKLGIEVSLRVVDSSQYINRIRDFDFDMIVGSFPQSLSPGNEQRDFWGSAAADRPGSRNVIGIKDPAIDKLIDHVIFAGSRAELVAASRALDRVLLWHFFVIPHFHNETDRVAYWNRFGRPAVKPKYSVGFVDTWWIDPAKDQAVTAKRGRRQ